ncbi:MAG: S1-like domain-containing RNA-binding protein [Eubacteriales bacterium]
MIEIGKKQFLTIVKKVEFGVYLSPLQNGEEEKVLLPKKQVPEELDLMDTLEVFVYRDSKDRLIATTKEPRIQLGEVAMLRVAQVGTIGAFLDWGLEKDLLLPFKEQTRKVQEGEECLVALYLDKSKRLCATMNVYEYLSKESPYEKEALVQGLVYLISEDFGAFVAVDHKYSALIPKKELYGNVQVGEVHTCRVVDVKLDGKLDLSIREKAYLQIEENAREIMRVIEMYQGELPFNDKASPEVIKKEFQMSKNEFKRAVGNLLKSGHITITNQSIIKNM